MPAVFGRLPDLLLRPVTRPLERLCLLEVALERRFGPCEGSRNPFAARYCSSGAGRIRAHPARDTLSPGLTGKTNGGQVAGRDRTKSATPGNPERDERIRAALKNSHDLIQEGQRLIARCRLSVLRSAERIAKNRVLVAHHRGDRTPKRVPAKQSA